MSMEEPNNPEGIPHFSNRAMFSNKLESYRKRQKGFWLFFSECCGQCGERGFVENILTDVTEVRLESQDGEDRPDILLERKNRPPLWLLFTQPNPLSIEMLAYCMAHGIDIFELEGGKRPVECTIIRAHIAPRNCRDRKRRRLADIWKSLQKSEFARIGIREDMRSQARKQRESEQWLAEFEASWEAVRSGEVYCARCSNSLMRADENGFSATYASVHRADEQCGTVLLCNDCSFTIMGGWTGTQPDDAAEWLPLAGCPACETIHDEEMRDFYAAPPRDTVEMPASYGVRLVQEPEERVQQYEVADRTVNREELLAVVMMVQWCISLIRDTGPQDRFPRLLWMLTKELDGVVNAVMFTNNILDWKWREGVGDSYITEDEAQAYHSGDRWVPLKAFMAEIPPFPLTII